MIDDAPFELILPISIMILVIFSFLDFIYGVLGSLHALLYVTTIYQEVAYTILFIISIFIFMFLIKLLITFLLLLIAYLK